MKKSGNFDNEPVTRGEFREALDELQSHVDDSREEFRAELKDLKNVMKKILKLVQGIDAQMKEQRDIPDRVACLERAVFRLQTERR